MGISRSSQEHDMREIKSDSVSTSCQIVLRIAQSAPLQGSVAVSGAKNAVLVSIASLILQDGISTLTNVPASADVHNMIELLISLGARVVFDEQHKILTVDTRSLATSVVKPEIMRKMRASILVMGPLLQRFGKAEIALPGGCVIGSRPIDYHLKAFAKFGVVFKTDQDFLHAYAQQLRPAKIVLEYPSVGATENIMMLACMIQGTSVIINAALEPEVIDLMEILQKMGAHIEIKPPATIVIQGVKALKAMEHSVMPDRLEAGALLLAAAITKGNIELHNVRAHDMDVFLEKLSEMGHIIQVDRNDIRFQATHEPKAVSFRTSPYPGFPTDLQAPMMAMLCLAEGKSVVHETVFEHRFLHIRELQKMGAQIEIQGDRATILGVDKLYGTQVIATDIRASCALALAGMAAQGVTHMSGLNHWRRGYDALEKKLMHLGARIEVI